VLEEVANRLGAVGLFQRKAKSENTYYTLLQILRFSVASRAFIYGVDWYVDETSFVKIKKSSIPFPQTSGRNDCFDRMFCFIWGLGCARWRRGVLAWWEDQIIIKPVNINQPYKQQ
jgi:hypothetical protein